MASLAVQTTSLRRALFYTLLVLVSAGLALLAVMVPLMRELLSPSLEVGEVAPQEVLAPQEVSFYSEILTEQRREAAARAIAPVYSPPDTGIARLQLENLRTTLAYINTVRADLYATQAQKLADLAALDDVQLSQDVAERLLALSDARWQAVQQESIAVLERVMRTAIRPDRLQEARSNLPSLVSLDLTEEQAGIVVQLTFPYITANSQFSEPLTEAARQQAREAVEPVQRTYKAGQTVVQRGRVLESADVEALQQLGLAQPQHKWQDFASPAILVGLLFAFVIAFLYRSPGIILQPRSLILIVGLFLAFLLGARLLVPGHTVLPYAFPVAAFGLLVAALFGSELALVTALPLAILVAHGLPYSMELTLYYLIASLFGVLTLGKARRVTSFFWAGLGISFSGMLMVFVYRLLLPATDLIGLATLAGAALFNGLAAASLTLILQFFLAQLLGMTTPMQLMDLTRPDHPLLRKLLHDAPGTYQHSLQVANLAEQAAERIGADTLLVRVGALYHDTGKTANPVFFIENQVPGFLNPHDDLDPATSAATIIQHVPDGIRLAREYRLPHRIINFIAEHHGTMIARYQYARAVEAAGGDESKVNQEHFRYPGPRPQSRETAILLLADGSEARVRAERPRNEDDLRNVIRKVIEDRIAIGQLQDTNLTLHDLEVISDSFTATLRGIYHPRIQYPELETKASREITQPRESALPLQSTARETTVTVARPSASDVPVAATDPNPKNFLNDPS